MKTPISSHPIDELEIALDHRFATPALLVRAVTHSSFARENTAENAGDNEQLEFLGDAVLQLIASHELYHRFPAVGEGQLSKLRSHLVNAHHLQQCAQRLDLGRYLRLGHGEEKTGGRSKGALLADAMEAVIAALYLDGGWAVTRDFVLSTILVPELERLATGENIILAADHKSRLQELLQARGLPEPNYELIAQDGPPHCRTFTMQVRLVDPANGTSRTFAATGDSKKSASRAAAELALTHLESTVHG